MSTSIKSKTTKVISITQEEFNELKDRITQLEEMHDMLTKRMRQTGWIGIGEVNQMLVKKIDDPTNILVANQLK
jgi:two-component sensor histidine kinase